MIVPWGYPPIIYIHIHIYVYIAWISTDSYYVRETLLSIIIIDGIIYWLLTAVDCKYSDDVPTTHLLTVCLISHRVHWRIYETIDHALRRRVLLTSTALCSQTLDCCIFFIKIFWTFRFAWTNHMNQWRIKKIFFWYGGSCTR